MPRLQPIYDEFFHSPLTEDVEELLARFQQCDSVRYEVFSAIWRDMSFSDVFLGLNRVGELKRFCRVTLATAMKFFLPPYSYQIRVGGLYLLYAFYHTQVAVPPVKIRLALRDWHDVQKFFKDSVEAGHHDVVYIYQKLVATKAVHYAAMPHFLTYQKQKAPKAEAVCAEFLGRTTAVQELMSGDILEELTNIQNHYEKMKEGMAEVSCKVNMTHRDLVARLTGCRLDFITWQEKTFSQDSKDKELSDDEDKSSEAEASSRARLLSSIKQKSFSQFQDQSKSRRHRQAETVESSCSGTEPVQETVLRRKRPPSLRARTWKSLRVEQDESNVQAWLLSAPQQDNVPMKRTNQPVPYRP